MARISLTTIRSCLLRTRVVLAFTLPRVSFRWRTNRIALHICIYILARLRKSEQRQGCEFKHYEANPQIGRKNTRN